MGKKCLLSVIFSLFVILISDNLNAGPSLIISEVLFNPTGNEYIREWIEIYNSTSQTIDLTGYTLEDNQGTSSDFEFPSGAEILSGETLVIARDFTGFKDFYHFSPDLDDFSMLLNNSSDFLLLKDNGVVIDEVAWGSGIWSSVKANINGKSIIRSSLASGPSSWLSNQTPDPGSPAPLPEPESLILLGFGLLILGILRMRWKQN